MALVNMGVFLAKKNRKVLLVDFDLEAPGITTFDGLRKADKDNPDLQRGTIDLVQRYRDTKIAPSIKPYMYRAPLSRQLGKGELWIMPAGRRNSNYAQKLNDIDWNNLYEKEDGYFLFEDVKEQWNKDFQYVLIDSRTGHTDVGGLCTRHLADKIVFVFAPNEQNRAGAESILPGIRQPFENSDKTPPPIIAAASNVVNGAEHSSEFRDIMGEFKNVFYPPPKDDDDYHFQPDSFPYFVFPRDDTAALHPREIIGLRDYDFPLKKAYEAAANELWQMNFKDREGSLALLDSLKVPWAFREILSSENSRSHVSYVANQFANDAEMMVALSKFHLRCGDKEEALEACQKAKELDPKLPAIYAQEAAIYTSMAKSDQTIEATITHLKVISDSLTAGKRNKSTDRSLIQELNLRELYSAAERVIRSRPDLLKEICALKFFHFLDFESIELLCGIANSDKKAARVLAMMLGRIRRMPDCGVRLNCAKNEKEDQDRDRRGSSVHQRGFYLLGLMCLEAQLLISSGEFSRALSVLEQKLYYRSKHLLKDESPFNYFVAKWGAHNKPNLKLAFQIMKSIENGDIVRTVSSSFGRPKSLKPRQPVTLKPGPKTPNNQMLSILCSLTGDHPAALKAIEEASKAIDSATGPIFSIWSYRNEQPAEMKRHCKLLKKAIQDKRPTLGVFECEG